VRSLVGSVRGRESKHAGPPRPDRVWARLRAHVITVNVLICRIECTSVMSGLGGASAVLLGVDAGRCRRRTGRGSGRRGGMAGPRSGRPGWGGVGPFVWVPADLGYGGREARRSSIWRASPSARVARRLSGEWRRARRRSGLAGIRERTSRSVACIRRPMGHPPGPTTCTAVRGAPPLREKVVSSQQTTKAKARRSHSLPLLTYSAPGGLRQDLGRAAESAAGPRTDEDMGPRRACVVVDGRGTR
jgi:hypothetical protein